MVASVAVIVGTVMTAMAAAAMAVVYPRWCIVELRSQLL